MPNEFQLAISEIESNEFNPFLYLKNAHDLLSNPVQEKEGRELIIRALASKDKFDGYEGILKNLVRNSGLFPYLDSEFASHSIEEELLLNVYRANFANDFVFHSMQFKIFNLLIKGHNVVLSAPTSMGKSAIVDSLIASFKYNRIVFVVPTIALIDETRRRIYSKFGSDYDIIHHNSQKTRRNRKVLFILTQERVNERDDIDNIDLFIIDEFYKLAFTSDLDERAISLNIALSKLLVVSKQFYMIGPNIDDIRGLKLLTKEYVFIPSAFNTVAINVFEYNIEANNKVEKNNKLAEILEFTHREAKGSNQTIIYCKSPQSAAEVARELIRRDICKEFNSPYTDWIVENYSVDWSYSKAIKNGIGIHHGSLPRAIQQHTVDLFNKKEIQFLICTSTIIEGVNTIAKNVIIYDNRNGTRSIDSFTHNNIKGRAGRMKVHFVGNVYCLEKIPEQTIESRVVDVPLGLQNANSPYNLLAGIQSQHIDSNFREGFDSFIRDSGLPIDLLKKHANFPPDKIKNALNFAKDFSRDQLEALCLKGYPNSEAIEIICNVLRIIAPNALRRCNLQFENSGELKGKLQNYLFSKTHQIYMNTRIDWLRNNSIGEVDQSNGIDRELKIIRNIFAYTVPKVLSLLEDIINLVCEKKGIKLNADYSLAIAIFENSHLPGSFSALEEMGIPIQTLEKLVTERLKSSELNVLIRFLRLHSERLKNLSELDYSFIKRALS